MTVAWSGGGPGVLVALDRRDGTPLGHQLQDQLRAAVRGGRLRAGERLPSSRDLARELGVSRGMVVSCYDQLLAEGYLVAEIGSGTWVAEGVAESVSRSRATASSPSDLADPAAPEVDVDFEYGVPDLHSAP